MRSTISELDLMTIVAMFGKIAGLGISMAEKRQRGLDELSRFLDAKDWAMEEVDGLGSHPDEDTRCLIAVRGQHRLIFRRENGAATFGARERDLFELVTTRIPWLLELEAAVRTDAVRLSPQMQKVFVLICLGSSRKGIADILQLRLGTVDGYVRDLYKIHGVRSQRDMVRLHGGSRITTTTPATP